MKKILKQSNNPIYIYTYIHIDDIDTSDNWMQSHFFRAY